MVRYLLLRNANKGDKINKVKVHRSTGRCQKQNTGAYANTGIPKCAFCTDFKWHTGRVDKEGETELAYIWVSRGFEASLVKFGHSSGAKFCSAYSVKQS